VDGLRVARWVPVTEAEGPGRRFALWLQGCPIRCPGCCNPDLWDPAGGREVEVAVLARALAEVRGEVEGLTLVGGEPFAQAGGAACLARAARDLGLSVAVFTGHLREELEQRPDPGTAALLAATDLLVDGPYDPALPERGRRWVGSRNQRFHRLTGRYPPGLELVRLGEPAETVELHLGADGSVLRSGWPVG
jgi:anaerobic ribonucleoside-triphosphate reductase activating protein